MRSIHLVLIYCLFFFSGISALILQIAWMYQLSLIFGNASYATATTLATFFMGIAIGGWYWGNKSVKIKKPLFTYGLIEIGIAISGLLLLPAIEIYKGNYNLLYSVTGGNPYWIILLKFLFSTFLLIIPTILMGGTFPLLSKYVGKQRKNLEKRGTVLYTLNTVGAAIGAFLTGFYLIEKFGMQVTYILAITLSFSVGVLAMILCDKFKNKESGLPIKLDAGPKNKVEESDNTVYKNHLSTPQFIILALSSGFLALSLELLLFRMFAQVLQNSVYSFSAILVVFLISLGFGGIIANRLAQTNYGSKEILFLFLLFSSLTIGISPIIFNIYTDGLEYIAPYASWPVYLVEVFKLSISIVVLPATLLGTIFPFLLKAAPLKFREPGKFVGRLILFNSLGSFLGPLLAGFIFLQLFGLWVSIKLIAILYAVLALYISLSLDISKKVKWSFLTVIIIGGIFFIKDPAIVQLRPQEKLLEYWNSNNGVVSITKSENNLQMRLDNFYILGDSESLLVEQMQAHIPLFVHPSPKKVLFLGMGTGITAGASLDHTVSKVVVVELIGNIVTAAKKYFSSWTNGLFTDDRVDILKDDARNYVLGTNESFDVIIGDLFTPWHAGTGSLYTVENFQQIKKTLNPGGLFAQWLPMYQLTPEDFNTIAATFSSVFPQVTVWRADFNSTRPSIALIGQDLNAKLAQQSLKENISKIFKNNRVEKNDAYQHMVGLFYIGNLKVLKNNLDNYILNTDDKRVVEFKAPKFSQQANALQGKYLVGEELEKLTEMITSELPPKSDPYLSELPPDEKKYIKVGMLYSRYIELFSKGKKNEAKLVEQQIKKIAPNFLK